MADAAIFTPPRQPSIAPMNRIAASFTPSFDAPELSTDFR
jgi:hypothetical protein